MSNDDRIRFPLPEGIEDRGFGTGMHYKECISSRCTGCFLPAIWNEPPSEIKFDLSIFRADVT